MSTFNIIISGVTVFILGQVVVRFFLEPLHKFKEVKGEIASILLFHANNYGHEYKNIDDALDGDGEGGDERVITERIESIKKWNNDLSKASDETRAVAAKLISVAEGIPFYEFLTKIKVVPTKGSIITAKNNLIGLSNSFSGKQQLDSAGRSDEICKFLNINFMNE